MTTPETLDSILLEGLESYEQSVKLVRHNDYLVTPLASYLFRLGQHHYDRGQLGIRGTDVQSLCFRLRGHVRRRVRNAAIHSGRLLELGYRHYEKTNRHSQKLQALEKGLNFAKEFARLDENFLPEISEFTERIDASRHSTGQL